MLLSASSSMCRLLYIASLMRNYNHKGMGCPRNNLCTFGKDSCFFLLSTVLSTHVDFMGSASEACNPFGLSVECWKTHQIMDHFCSKILIMTPSCSKLPLGHQHLVCNHILWAHRIGFQLLIQNKRAYLTLTELLWRWPSLDKYQKKHR